MRERRSLPEHQQAAINALRRQYRDALASTIQRGCERGVFAVPDPTIASMAVLDMVNGLAHWFRPRDRRDLERTAVRYGDAAVALVRGWGPDRRIDSVAPAAGQVARGVVAEGADDAS